MRLFATIGMSLALLVLGVSPCWAQQDAWQPVHPQGAPQPSRALLEDVGPLLGAPEPIITLGAPEPIAPQAAAAAWAGGNSASTSDLLPLESPGARPPTMVWRGQAPDPTPSPFGGGGAVGVPAPPPPPGPLFGPPNNPVDCGVPGDGKQSFWDRLCGNAKDCGKNVFGSCGDMFKTSPEHKPFQSDHEFEMFSSPITNPFFFLDPRSLTEVKPLFIFQQTRNSNPIFAGGSNEYLGLQASLALTEWISIKISELGISFMEPRDPSNNPAFAPNVGISELHIGPQFTLIRNKDTNTLLAVGFTFEVPWGSGHVFQDTGLGFVPYVSFAQNFAKSKYGSVNFMNTTGWSGGTDRSDFFFSSFHFDYNINNLNRFFPMVELNWAHYTSSGNQIPINFEGFDLYNFGATGVAGTNNLTLNLGGRVKINNFWSVGLAGGFSLIGGGNQLDAFRLTADMIFRY